MSESVSKSQQRRVHSLERIHQALKQEERFPGTRHKVESCRNCSKTILTAPRTSHLKDIYEFGVFDGLGMRTWLAGMPRFNVSTAGRHAFGFDSFRGMPEELSRYIRPMHRDNKHWGVGGLNVAKMFKMENDWERLQEAITQQIGFDPARTHLIKGFYNESLAAGRALAADGHAVPRRLPHRL